MSDLISREALIETIGKLKVDYYVDMNGKHNPIEQANKIINCIEDAPTVEAVPVVHGEWLDFYGDYSTAECDQCAECYEVSPDSEPKKEYFEAFKQCYNFCPNCGADMRKKV